MQNWYVLKDGEVQGPFDREQIRRMAWTGNLAPDDPVTCDRLPFWYPARDISGLEFAQKPAPPAANSKSADAGQSPPASGVSLPPTGSDSRPPPPAAAAIPTSPQSLPVAVPVPPLPPSDQGVGKPPSAGPPPSASAVRPAPAPAGDAGATGQASRGQEPAPVQAEATGCRKRRISRKRKARRESIPEIEVVDGNTEAGGLTTATAIEEAPGISIDWELVGKTILVLLAVTIVLMPVIVWRVWSGRHPARSRRNPEVTRTEIIRTSGEVLGTYLALKWPGSKAVLVVPPRNCSDFREEWISAARAGLVKGFGGEVRVIGEAAPEMSVAKKVAWEKKSGGNGRIPALRYWFDAGAMDGVLEQCSDADVIVSLVGLPSDMDLMQFWRTPAAVRPAVAVLLGDVPPGKTQRALKAGWLAAVVDYNPGRNLRYPFLTPRKNAAFTRYCRLVTPENVKAFARRYPDLFAP